MGRKSTESKPGPETWACVDPHELTLLMNKDLCLFWLHFCLIRWFYQPTFISHTTFNDNTFIGKTVGWE